MLIKICGVKDPHIASFAAKCGADFIGMILTPGFRRSVTFEQANQIADAARQAGAKPVAVFVNTSSDEIKQICSFLKIEYVQVYQPQGPLSIQLKRFYPQAEATLQSQDFLLIESSNPGSGETLDLSTFVRPKQSPWFLAGGLTLDNVRAFIQHCQPDGVDVSSGVEVEGCKNEELILKFIQEVRS